MLVARPRSATAVLVLLSAAGLPSRAGAAEADGPVVHQVFDRELGPPPRSWLGRRPLDLAIQELPPRLAGVASPISLPFAWRLPRLQPDAGAARTAVELEGGPEIDTEATLRLRQEMAGISIADLVAATLADRLRQAGIGANRLAGPEVAGLLVRETVEDGRAETVAGRIRTLTRGNVGDRWSLRAGDERRPPRPGVELAPVPLLQVDVVSFGLHLADSSYRLPGDFLHVTLHARVWDLASGERRWDRLLMLGLASPHGAGDDTAAAARVLGEAGAGVVAAALGADGGSRQAVIVPLSESPPPETQPVVSPEPARLPRAESPRSLADGLTLLAGARLGEPPSGDAWQDLAEAIERKVPAGLGLVLSCAEDPVDASVDVAVRDLGLGRAEALQRLRSSPPFRRALAEDVLARIRESAGVDELALPAAEALLAELRDSPADSGRRAAVAARLLERAFRDGLRSPSSIADLLIASRLAPDDVVQRLPEMLEAVARDDPRRN